jgi:hypothetical protein
LALLTNQNLTQRTDICEIKAETPSVMPHGSPSSAWGSLTPVALEQTNGWCHEKTLKYLNKEEKTRLLPRTVVTGRYRVRIVVFDACCTSGTASTNRDLLVDDNDYIPARQIDPGHKLRKSLYFGRRHCLTHHLLMKRPLLLAQDAHVSEPASLAVPCGHRSQRDASALVPSTTTSFSSLLRRAANLNKRLTVAGRCVATHEDPFDEVGANCEGRIHRTPIRHVGGEASIKTSRSPPPTAERSSRAIYHKKQPITLRSGHTVPKRQEAVGHNLGRQQLRGPLT